MKIFPAISDYRQWLPPTLSATSIHQPFFTILTEKLNWPKAIHAVFGDRKAVLKLLGVEADDYIVLPNLNALPWAEAAKTLGADCILIDHHPDHWQMDLDLLEEFLMNFTMLNERDDLVLKKDSRRLKAIILPHLLGGMCDMDRLAFIALRFNLKLGEDITQALGSTWKGQAAGSFGHVNFCAFRNNPILPFGQPVVFSAEASVQIEHKHTEIYPTDVIDNQLGTQLIDRVPDILGRLQQLDRQYRENLSEFQLNWLKPLPEVQTNGLSAAFTSHRELHAGAVRLYQSLPPTLHHSIPFRKSLYIRREDWSTQIFQSAWLLPLGLKEEGLPENAQQALAGSFE